jgi:hypothetical protein
MLSRNRDNEVAVHCSIPFTSQKLVVRERQGLQYCTRATILHPATFKKRIGQYLQQKINITVQNEEISVIYHHMGLKNGLQSLEISDMKGRWRRKCPCGLVRARLVAWWRAQIFGPRVDTGYAGVRCREYFTRCRKIAPEKARPV